MSKLNLEILEELGKFTKQLRKEVSKMPKIGLDITQIIDFIEKSIFEKGYLPAFPCTVSVNDIAAHYTVFDEGYILKKGDVIKIDFGLSQDGYITDNAVTVEVEDNKYGKLMQANLEGLNAVMEKVDYGVSMSELGEIVDKIAVDNGFNTIHNLCGHQVDRNNLHCGLNVPNFKNNDSRKVEEGMALAIEPFFTTGNPQVKSCGLSNIVHLVADKPIRDPIAKKVLTHIKENYPHLPFSKRWLINDVIKKINPTAKDAFEKRKVLYALKLLKSNNIIYEYDALATVDGSIVSQFEDMVVFVDGKKSIITRL